VKIETFLNGVFVLLVWCGFAVVAIIIGQAAGFVAWQVWHWKGGGL